MVAGWGWGAACGSRSGGVGGSRGGALAALVEGQGGGVGKHPPVAETAAYAVADEVPGKGHGRVLRGDIDVEHGEVRGNLPPGFGDLGLLGGAEGCRNAVIRAVGGAAVRAPVEIEVDGGRGVGQAVQVRQTADVEKTAAFELFQTGSAAAARSGIRLTG